MCGLIQPHEILNKFHKKVIIQMTRKRELAETFYSSTPMEVDVDNICQSFLFGLKELYGRLNEFSLDDLLFIRAHINTNYAVHCVYFTHDLCLKSFYSGCTEEMARILDSRIQYKISNGPLFQ